MGELHERATLPDNWLPNDEVLKILTSMQNGGNFGGTEATQNVFGRLAIGIATASDRKFLAVMSFLNSIQKIDY